MWPLQIKASLSETTFTGGDRLQQNNPHERSNRSRRPNFLLYTQSELMTESVEHSGNLYNKGVEKNARK